ncbi:hypothetical protein LALCM10_50044 [Dellaglioa algida]|nr:hypothetical protein LALCM10_50044 [Dellaglioa algida]
MSFYFIAIQMTVYKNKVIYANLDPFDFITSRYKLNDFFFVRFNMYLGYSHLNLPK